MTPLSFSDEQLDLVTRAAGLLPTHDRNRFLRSIANRLEDTANPTDFDIRSAIDFILGARLGGGKKAFIPARQKQQAKGIFR
jgi:hypothetical protein